MHEAGRERGIDFTSRANESVTDVPSRKMSALWTRAATTATSQTLIIPSVCYTGTFIPRLSIFCALSIGSDSYKSHLRGFVIPHARPTEYV